MYAGALKDLPNDAGLLNNSAVTRLRLGDQEQVCALTAPKCSADACTACRGLWRAGRCDSALSANAGDATGTAGGESRRAAATRPGRGSLRRLAGLAGEELLHTGKPCCAEFARRARSGVLQPCLFTAHRFRLTRRVLAQGKAALEMGSPALACSRLSIAVKLAPDDACACQKLSEAVRFLHSHASVERSSGAHRRTHPA